MSRIIAPMDIVPGTIVLGGYCPDTYENCIILVISIQHLV